MPLKMVRKKRKRSFLPVVDFRRSCSNGRRRPRTPRTLPIAWPHVAFLLVFQVFPATRRRRHRGLIVRCMPCKTHVDAPSIAPYNWSLSLAPGGSMYAVIKTGGKQYRVAPGDTIRIERVEGKVGEKVTFGSVLSVHGDDKKLLTGADAAKAVVSGKIVAQDRAKKLTVLKFKKTNQYKIQRGHRQNYTAVEVNDINLYVAQAFLPVRFLYR